jgi:hypothetical protein
MKNKNFKIAALLALALVGALALNKVNKNNKEKAKMLESIKTDLPTATPENPLTFTVQGESKDLNIRYTFDGKKYMKFLQSPLVRAAPQEITKEEFESAYNAFLL